MVTNGMKRIIEICLCLGWAGSLCFGVEAVTAIHGTVSKLDATAKTIAVKTKDGAETTVRWVSKTIVRGADAGAKDTFKGIKEGSEVVVHYTEKGSDKTAMEVDKLGKDGMKATDGTVTAIDRGSKTIAVKTADGTVKTFKLGDQAAVDAGKGVEKGTEKAAHVTVYYTEDAGKQIVHFFETH